MCSKCIDEATSTDKCIRCGTNISNVDRFVNPRFDSNRFNELSQDDDGVTINKNFNADKFNQLNGGD